MEIELTQIYFKYQKYSEWVIDLISKNKISTGSKQTKKEALILIKELQKKYDIDSYKLCNKVVV